MRTNIHSAKNRDLAGMKCYVRSQLTELIQTKATYDVLGVELVGWAKDTESEECRLEE